MALSLKEVKVGDEFGNFDDLKKKIKGSDHAHGRTKKPGRQGPVAKDIYLRLLVKLYRFLNRRASSDVNTTILKRLYSSRTKRLAVGLGNICRKLSKNNNENKIAVVVADVTDDVRFHGTPKIKLVALRVTERARARILAAGGEIMTFDQYALREPKGANSLLFRTPTEKRKVYKHFGKAPGVPGSKALPYDRRKKGSRKAERSRSQINKDKRISRKSMFRHQHERFQEAIKHE